MKVLLMHEDRDFDLDAAAPWNEAELVQDLELDRLLDGMSQGDKFLRGVAAKAVLCGLSDPAAIRYRQAVLRDCLDNRKIVRAVYRAAAEATEAERKRHRGIHGTFPDAVLQQGVELVQLHLKSLEAIRDLAADHAHGFRSAGFTQLFAMLRTELDDDYLETVRGHLSALRLRHGVLIGARLGQGHAGTDYVLCKPSRPAGGWLGRLLDSGPETYSYQLPARDDVAAQAFTELRQRGINTVANALAQSAEHIVSYLRLLRAELGFYVGCINLDEQLTRIGAPTCLPEPLPPEPGTHRVERLYDVCLALDAKKPAIASDLPALDKGLIVVTGANRGGKSTFLRAVGLAQLMMRCGMFVAASGYAASVCGGVVTHFRREEDRAMRSGKLDEELARMSGIVDRLPRHALVLLNESFAATNEREGSEIARQIVLALRERGVTVFFVTHLYAFARGLDEDRRGDTLFLRAERLAGGERTFRMVEGRPQQTSHGSDLYRRIFEVDGDGRMEVRSAKAALDRVA